MDNIDLSIIELLSQDARHSDAELAVMLNLEPSDVTERKARLEQEGVIIGYSAVVNTEALEDDSVSALIEVKAIPQRNRGFDEIAEQLYQFDEVKSCYLMSGAYDLLVLVEARTLKELALFVSQKLSTLETLTGTATSFVLKRYKEDGVVFEDANTDNRLVVSP